MHIHMNTVCYIFYMYTVCVALEKKTQSSPLTLKDEHALIYFGGIQKQHAIALHWGGCRGWGN